MADAALSAFLQVLFDRIATLIEDEVTRQRGLEGELNNLQRTLIVIDGILEDASSDQNRGKAAAAYLRQLKDIAYDANDVSDLYMTEAIRRRLVRLPKVPQFTGVINPKRFMFQHNTSKYVTSISTKLDNIFEAHQLIPREVRIKPRHAKERGQSTTTSLRDPSRTLIGGERERKNIISLLVTKEHSVKGPSVVLVQGPPGHGKTFLSRAVYTDESVKTHFDLKMWVHVSSNGFHVESLTNKILETIENRKYSDLQLENLQSDLKSKMEGTWFLMVLDDVGDLTHEDWKALLVPLQYAARSSRILITTQTKAISNVIGVEPICLDKLSYEATLSLFCKEAFEDPNSFQFLPDVQQTIIHEIVRDCQGSPLAATTLGYLLRLEPDIGRWRSTPNNFNRNVLQGRLRDVFMLSYQLLPHDLSRCFGYLAAFPRGYEFQKDVLIRLWMAQDYMGTEKDGKRVEDVGAEYFDSLLNLSCFLLLSPKSGDLRKYKVHEHFHQLAVDVSKEEYCVIEHENGYSVTNRVRHLSLPCNHSSLLPSSADHSSTEAVNSPYSAQGLYSLLFLGGTRGSAVVPLHDLVSVKQ